MKIALLGYGKMGKLIEREALLKNHEIVLRSNSLERDFSKINHADICIDFSNSESVIDHLSECVNQKKNLVIGTTGWEEKIPDAKKLVEKSGIGVLYAPNFSMGVHHYIKILEYAAKVLGEYDAAGVEWHHNQKKDAPSGTAKEIMKRLGIEFSSVRCGSIPGKHEVVFDSPFDAITICHEAKGRDAFAKGALDAAEWLIGKKGFYTLEDICV